MSEPFFEGRLRVIRPLLLVEKADIARAARQWELPLWSNPCPSAGSTRRADMMTLLDTMCEGSKVRRKNIFQGLTRWQMAKDGEKARAEKGREEETMLRSIIAPC